MRAGLHSFTQPSLTLKSPVLGFLLRGRVLEHGVERVHLRAARLRHRGRPLPGFREAAHRGLCVPLRYRAGLGHVSRNAAIRNAGKGTNTELSSLSASFSG